MNDTFVFIIIDCLLLIMSILFFSKYNNGKGGSLGSFRKRVLYFFSVLLFIGFVICVNKTFYCYQEKNPIYKELLNAYEELDLALNTVPQSSIIIREKKDNIKNILLEMNNNDKYHEAEIYLNLFNGLTSTFIAFIIAFTFKNKILG